jgi:cellobiose phosphorylase
VTEQDRGETYLDKFEEEQGNFGGGYSYVDDGNGVWASAYKWRPPGSKTTRRFGTGYAQTMTMLRGIKVTHTFVAPPGDANALVDDVAIENTNDGSRTLKHWEVWDVARRHIETDWLVSGSALPNAPANVRAKRDARNALFDETVDWTNNVLGLRRVFRGTPPVAVDAPSATDYFPADQFLAVLAGEATDTFTDQNAFFGAGGITKPALLKGTELGTRSGDGQPRAFVVQTNLTLVAHEKKSLRFAYGYAPHGEPFAIDPSWATRDLRKEIVDDQRAHSMSFASDRDPVLHREMAWHASQLESSVGWRAYWGRHVVPQGSAYLFLHGADGALRDLALFAVPLVYTHRSLAKEELLLACGMHRADTKAFSYAFQGHGMLDDASGVHHAPSDLDIFFLWAVAEYVLATGDDAFLDEPAPYWPKEAIPNATVRDHVRDAFRHLFDTVGTGPHGLVRVGTGDWSDGIDFEAPDRDLAVASGESVPNTQMALWVLPIAKALADPMLQQEIDMRVAALQAALPSAWAGSFYGRAYFGDGVLRYSDKINLEAQVWALVGNTFASDADRQKTIDAIATQLDTPVGAALGPGGQVWPAVSALLTWGWAKNDPERAWKHLAKNTLAGHAVAFPTVWYGIWSGPDGMTSTSGEAWSSLVTPMTDFPTMNANQHAMPMLAALRVLGIEPTMTGLRIAPHVPMQSIALHTELLDLRLDGSHVTGSYRPIGARKLEVVLGSNSVTLDIPAGGAPFNL